MKKKVTGFRGVVEARTGLLLGAVTRHTSIVFTSDREATRWCVVVGSTNKTAGRDVGRVFVETLVDGAITETSPEAWS